MTPFDASTPPTRGRLLDVHAVAVVGREAAAAEHLPCGPAQELVVAGWTPGEANARDVGALVVGVYEQGRLRFAGKVGSGCDARSRRLLRQRLDELAAEAAPFEPDPGPRPDLRGARWTRPELVIRAELGGWSRDGLVRQSAFKGIEEDRDPRTVVREEPVDALAVEAALERIPAAPLDLRHAQARMLIFFGLGALTLILSNVASLRFAAPDFQPVPSLPQETAMPAAPLFAAVPLLLAALRLGMGPAVLLSGFSALIQSGLQSGQTTQRYEVIAYGLVASFLIDQYYRGRTAATLRRPLVASLCGSLVAWAMMLPSLFVYTPGRPLEALNYAWPLYLGAFLPILAQGFLSGLVVEIIDVRWPQLRRRKEMTQDPLWNRTLSRRLLVPFIAFTLVVMALLLTVVSAAALRQATAQAITQMARDAQTASGDIESFLRSGQGLLSAIAAGPGLQTGSAQIQSTQLSAAMRQEPFYQQLLMFNPGGQLVSYAPLDQRLTPTLEEQVLVQRTLQTGAPQRSEVFSFDQQAYLSFVVPIGDQQGALLGRVNLQQNPVLQRLRDNLQHTLGAGVGYVVDGNQRVIIHPQAEQVLQNWPLDSTAQTGESINGGTVYSDRFPDGTPRLLYVLPGQGSRWTTAIELPRISVLELALQISTPLLLLLFFILIFASLGILLLTRAITRPIQELSAAAENITHGRLDQPIEIQRDDEVGRLAQSFEHMRQSLKGRVDDLSLLSRVSQTVSASLDLKQGVPPLLDGVRQAAPARVARLITLSENGEPHELFSRGEGPTELTPLDRAMVKLTVPGEQAILIDNVAKARSRAMIDPGVVGPGLKALASFPVRRQAQSIAVMWLGYAEPHLFAESEVNVLATIAGQAAVLIENARLYEASEGGRQQLAAVLASTNDAVVVQNIAFLKFANNFHCHFVGFLAAPTIAAKPGMRPSTN